MGSGNESGDLARELLERARKIQGEAAAKLGEPDFSKREAAWLLTVTDDDGTVYSGIFTSRVPGQTETTQIQLLVGQLLGGVAYASAPPSLLRRFEMQATIAVCLKGRPPGPEKGQPGWFDRPDDFFSDTVPAAVYAKIREHYEFFRDSRRRTAGPGTDGAAAGAAA